jgi:hypothetical protein
VLTTNDLQNCSVPEIKAIIDQYILGTNRPPWKLLGALKIASPRAPGPAAASQPVPVRQSGG